MNTSNDSANDSTPPPSIEPLTDRQRSVLNFIESQIIQMGYPPTIREIGKHLNIRSTNGVNDHLKALERKGYIKRQGQKSRTLRVMQRASAGTAAGDTNKFDEALPANVVPFQSVVGANDDMVEVKLLGRVAAGAPILAEENAEDTVRVSSFFLGRGANPEKVFALRVVGDSMIDDGIHDGDFLFVKKQPTARPGDIVVAMIEGEATVKRFFPEGDVIRLQPANRHMDPIFIKKTEFRQTDILGVVVGVYRKY